VTGLDQSAPAIAVARSVSLAEALPAQFVVGSAYKLPFPDAHFDGVVRGASLIERLGG
jgi:ubiquinone/menaquinone biosynthesis C-methylase UbiE